MLVRRGQSAYYIGTVDGQRETEVVLQLVSVLNPYKSRTVNISSKFEIPIPNPQP